MNKRYDLRPRSWLGRPPKKPIINEPQIKSTKTQTTTIQPLNQIAKRTLIYNTTLTTFNVERELERVKIPIPLSELSNNPRYKNQVYKWIQSSSFDAEGDVISLQDEKPLVVFGLSSNMIDENVPPFYVT